MARASKVITPVESGNIQIIDVASEMKSSFLEYSYSVIYSRALPDARDGLKPVQRRILFQMNQMGLRPDKGHVKSARVVGEVMGRLHPHGDSAIYDALVRMSQNFSLRFPLIDGHGNFGSPDDGPAAMRYTEARLSPAAIAMTENIDEEVIDFNPNYDGRELEPVVLPAAIPALLVNGASGIAVGMATNLVPHNLGEVIAAAQYLLAHPKAKLKEIMKFIQGPDLPGGGIIIGLDGIKEAYETGKGSFKVRARARIEAVTAKRQGIVVTELPQGVGPERIIAKVSELVQKGKLKGISDIADLSDGESGLNLVIELKAGFNPEAVLESLYQYTPLEESVTINAVALVDGEPRTLSLIDMLQVFLDHRCDVIRRRCEHRKKIAENRSHLVTGLLIAIADIDEIIAIIRSSDDTAAARKRLIEIFELSEIQANYILEMPLRRLTKFSKIELEKEGKTLSETIRSLNAILKDESKLHKLVSDELEEVAIKYGNPRRSILRAWTAINTAAVTLEEEDEKCRIFLSSTYLIGRIPCLGPDFPIIKRTKHDLVRSYIDSTSRGEACLILSNGLTRKLSILDVPKLLPEAHDLAGGAPLSAIIELPKKTTVVGLGNFENDPVLLVTKNGVVKRLILSKVARDTWDIISLNGNDEVIAAVSHRDQDAVIVLITSDAQLLYFPIAKIRLQGRSASGIQGIKLAKDQSVIAAQVVPTKVLKDALVGTVAASAKTLPGTSSNSVKISPLEIYPMKGRATGGVRCHKLRASEDFLITAGIGIDGIFAATTNGVPISLPAIQMKRDSVGEIVSSNVGYLGSPLNRKDLSAD